MKSKSKVLIVGAGEAGWLLATDIKRTGAFDIVGLVDDDPGKLGREIAGHTVLGTTDSIIQLITRYGVDEVLVALPSAGPATISRILRDCEKSCVPVRILPPAIASTTSPVGLRDLREVEVEDLLGREVTCTRNGEEVVEHFHGRSILVTGAAGSIGSQLCRELAVCKPKQLILLDNRETDLFKVHFDLSQLAPGVSKIVIADIRDERKMQDVFDRYRPNSVFHSAAYKHVHLMEAAPEEAVKTNVLGTRVVLDAAIKFGVHRFTLVSTDKAVNPLSVMGATKQIAELLVLDAAQRNDIICSVVRFGNVLGSNGSVVPVFHEQIQRGGPVTVTHPEATRYFISASEAAYLLLGAHILGKGGEIFVLDMGEPVQILELAKRMIALSGLKLDNEIKIVFCGLRAGEKLHEELITADQRLLPTASERILRVAPVPTPKANFYKDVQKLENLALEGDRATLITWLIKMFPTLTNGMAAQVAEPVAAPILSAKTESVESIFRDIPKSDLITCNEDQVLIAFLRAGLDRGKGREVTANLPHSLDWNVILRQAAQHGLLPLLYYHLRTASNDHSVPSKVLENLRTSYYHSATLNELTRETLKRLLQVFNEHGVKTMLLKGALLLPLIYKNSPVRRIGDIDLLVQESSLEIIERLLKTLGYSPIYKSDLVQRLYRTNHHHLAPYHGPLSALIEVHHDLLPLPRILGFGVEEAWSKAWEVKLAEGRVFSLSHEHMLLYLCAHSLFTDGNILLRQVMDISQFLKIFNDQIDWTLFEHYLRECPVRRAVRAMLQLVHEITLASVPESRPHRQRFSLMEDKLMTVMKKRVFREREKPIPPPVAQFFFLEGFDKIRLFKKVFLPHPFHQVDPDGKTFNRTEQSLRLAREYISAILTIMKTKASTPMQNQGSQV